MDSIEAQISWRTVVCHFLRVEAGKTHPSHNPEVARRAEELLNMGPFDTRFRPGVKAYALWRHQTLGEVNPVFVWIVGVVEPPRPIESWVSWNVPSKFLYSRGVNPDVDKILLREDIHGNLRRFLQAGPPKGFLEMQPLEEELKRIIVVAIPGDRAEDKLAVLDGVHRSLYQISDGIEEIPAYVALPPGL